MLATIHTAKEAYPVDVPTDFLYNDWDQSNQGLLFTTWGDENLSQHDTGHQLATRIDQLRRAVVDSSSHAVNAIRERVNPSPKPFLYEVDGLLRLIHYRTYGDLLQQTLDISGHTVAYNSRRTRPSLASRLSDAFHHTREQIHNGLSDLLSPLAGGLGAEQYAVPHDAIPAHITYHDLLLRYQTNGRFLNEEGRRHLLNGAVIATDAFLTQPRPSGFRLLFHRSQNITSQLDRYAAQAIYADTVNIRNAYASLGETKQLPHNNAYPSVIHNPSRQQGLLMRDEAASWPLYQERRHHAPDAFPSLMYARTAAPVAMRENATSRPIAKATEHETSRGIAVIPDPKDPTAFVLSSADTPEVDCKVKLIGNAVRVILVENGREKLNTQEMYAPYLLSQIDEGNREQADKAMHGIQRALEKYLANITDNTLSKYSAEQIVAILSECTEKIAHQTSFTMA